MSAWAREIGIGVKSLSDRLERHPLAVALNAESPKRQARHLALSNKKSSRFLGVSSRKKSRHYEARLKVGSRVLYFGYFARELTAARAVQRGLIELKAEREVRLIRRSAAKGTPRERLIPRLRNLIFLTSTAVRLLPNDAARDGFYRRPESLPKHYDLPLPRDVLEELVRAAGGCDNKNGRRDHNSRRPVHPHLIGARNDFRKDGTGRTQRTGCQFATIAEGIEFTSGSDL